MTRDKRDSAIKHLLMTTTLPLREIGAKVGLTTQGVFGVQKRLGIFLRPQYEARSAQLGERDQAIVARIGRDTLQAIANDYGITRERVRQIGNRHGIVSKLCPRLDPAKVADAVQWIAHGMPVVHAAETVGLHPSSLSGCLIRKGLHTPTADVTPWAPDEVAFLREHYGKEGWSARRVAEALGRTKNEIIGKAHRLGLQGAVASRLERRRRLVAAMRRKGAASCKMLGGTA